MRPTWPINVGSVLALAVCGLVATAWAQDENEEVTSMERPALRVGSLPSSSSSPPRTCYRASNLRWGPPARRVKCAIPRSGFLLDGVLSEPVWATADSISSLVTIEPEEGGTPATRTVIKVLTSPSEIVIGVFCEDAPGDIVAFSKERDSELEQEDHILFVFDTFLDGRSGYVFAVNPNGARFDGLVAEKGEEVNSDWDAIWEARTSRDDTGWYAEIRIPIQSIAFEKDLTTWGFNVQRRVQRLQETSRWSGASRDFEIFQTSRAGLLTDIGALDLGVGMSIRPSVIGTADHPEPDADVAFDGDIALDITQKLGPNMLAALTANTDFAETEVDVRQINLTRFPSFFPEKRTFFLEGADIFEFGLGLDEDNLIPFFSRRIGLVGLKEGDQTEIPVNAGGKINGRMGNTNLGALVVNTRRVDSLTLGEDVTLDVPTTTMGAVRVSQNILAESSVGMSAAFGDQLGRSRSWSGGVDFTYRTSEFGDEKNLLVGVWGLLNDREDLEGDKYAWGARIDYPNDLWAGTLTTIRVGDGFDPSLGFVPRNDVQIWDFAAEFKPRPSWSLVRQMLHEVALTVYARPKEIKWESYSAEVKPVDWIFESGDRVSIVVSPQGDRPPEAFELADEVVIPVGSYEWTRFILEGRAAEKRKIGGEIKWESGRYYNGDLNTIEASLALRPSALLTVELMAERNSGTVMALVDEDTGELEDTQFTEELLGLRLQVNFSADLQVSSLTQYDTQSRELGSNNKLRWTFHPLGDLFVVYNTNFERGLDDRWQFLNAQVPIKIQYSWRF